MVTSAASSFRMNACASPTATKSSRYSARHASAEYASDDADDDDTAANELRSSRYRLLDEHERSKEAANVERMIRELQVQRQSRSRPQSARAPGGSSSSSRRGAPASSHDAGAAAARSNQTLRASLSAREKQRRPSASARSPIAVSGSSRLSSKSRDPRTHPSTTTPMSRCKTQQHSPPYDLDDDEDGADELESPVSKSASFQKRVLDELQKLKQAQLKDLEAIQQLQREKELAERRARQLEAQFRSSSASSPRHRSSVAGSTSIPSKQESRTLVIDEPLTSDDDDDGLNLSFDANDLGDESMPPPQYDDEGAPAPLTSPADDASDLDFLSSPEPSPPPKWTRSIAPESVSPVFAKSITTRASFGKESQSDVHSREQRGRSESRHQSHRKSLETQQQQQSHQQKLVQTWEDSQTDDAVQRSGDRQPRRASSRSRSPSGSFRRRSSSRGARRASCGAIGKGDEFDGADVRKSCSFFDEKQRAKDEEARIAAEAAERLERAKRARPPTQLLERQQQARLKKDAQLRRLDEELNAELSKEKRVKAREVPLSTYVIAAPALTNSAAAAAPVFVTSEELEAQRKERIRQRAQQLLESSELPPRMAQAMNSSTLDQQQQQQQSLNGASSSSTRPSTGVMSVKMKKQLAAAAEEDARRQRMKPKPVPNFDHLHAQWTKLMKFRKASAGVATSGDECLSSTDKKNSTSTTTREFFTSRAAKLEELRAKKAARKQKQLEREEQERRAQREAQVKLLEKTKASSSKQALAGGDASGSAGASGSASASASTSAKPTKADELRVKKVLEKMVQSQKQQEKEVLEAEARQQRMKLAAKRVGAQVRASERSRTEGRSDYVSIREIDAVAKQRAQEFKQSLKESIAQNKQRILGAVASKPSLMERFATDLKREEHKKAALEAVVKNVFGKNLSVMKGILTDDEHDLARDIVAADDEDGKDDGDNGGSSSKKKAQKKDDDDEENEYSDA